MNWDWDTSYWWYSLCVCVGVYTKATLHCPTGAVTNAESQDFSLKLVVYCMFKVHLLTRVGMQWSVTVYSQLCGHVWHHLMWQGAVVGPAICGMCIGSWPGSCWCINRGVPICMFNSTHHATRIDKIHWQLAQVGVLDEVPAVCFVWVFLLLMSMSWPCVSSAAHVRGLSTTLWYMYCICWPV